MSTKQKKHKPLFAEMIAQHPGLAEELAQQDAQAVPQGATFAGWLREWEGDDSDLGQWLFAATEEDKDDSPNWRPVYWLNAAPTPPAQRVTLTPEEIQAIWSDLVRHVPPVDQPTQVFASAVIEAYERKNGLKP